jgi:hypothetical protein
VVFQLIYEYGGDLFFDMTSHFRCSSNFDQVIPLTNTSALYTLIHDTIMLFFSSMVLIVFYVLPSRFKLVADTSNGKI